MKKSVVWGMGISGRACVNYLLSKGDRVIAIEKNWNQEELIQWKNQSQITCLDEKDYLDFNEIKEVVISPGISKKHPLYQKILGAKIPITSDVNMGLNALNAKKIAITGTNGKTTLTAFLTHLLNCANIKAKSVGNIGLPFTQEAMSTSLPSFYVCELSSYQLESLDCNDIDIAVILDITEDHLDRYDSFRSYVLAKLHLLKCLKKEALAIVTAKTWGRFKDDILERKNDIIIIPSEFNYENKNCYLQLTKNKEYCDFLPLVEEKAIGLELLFIGKTIADDLSIEKKVLYQALETFQKPEHRLEWVRTLDEVSFINDSKATNVESVIYAVSALKHPIVLIAGGKDKGLCYEPWIKAFKSKVIKVLTIGECREKIYDSLSNDYDVEMCQNLKQAIEKAYEMAKGKMHVLLSPGCSSFDSFKDYRHRGETFKEIVMGLKKRL